MVSRVLLLSIYVLVLGCTKDDALDVEDATCIIDKISSAEFVYEYKYNVDGDLFLINQDFRLEESEVNVLRIYLKSINPDSIVIGRLLDGFQQEAPRITTKYSDGNLTEVKRFLSGGDTQVFRFEYTSEKIRINIDFDSAEEGIQKISYGDYFLNAEDNVERVEKYEFGEDLNLAILVEEKRFTYDSANNPWRGLLYPVFLCSELPKARFFSTNNILSETTDLGVKEFQYFYEDNITVGANVFLFSSCAPSNETVQETYTYTNCSN